MVELLPNEYDLNMFEQALQTNIRAQARILPSVKEWAKRWPSPNVSFSGLGIFSQDMIGP